MKIGKYKLSIISGYSKNLRRSNKFPNDIKLDNWIQDYSTITLNYTYNKSYVSVRDFGHLTFL